MGTGAGGWLSEGTRSAARRYGDAMDVTFRRATNADCEIAQQVVEGALRDYGLHIALELNDVDLVDLERHYDACGGCFEVLEGEGAVLGVLGWRPAGAKSAGGDRGDVGNRSNEIIELKKLYLVAGARGVG